MKSLSQGILATQNSTGKQKKQVQTFSLTRKRFSLSSFSELHESQHLSKNDKIISSVYCRFLRLLPLKSYFIKHQKHKLVILKNLFFDIYCLTVQYKNRSKCTKVQMSRNSYI